MSTANLPLIFGQDLSHFTNYLKFVDFLIFTGWIVQMIIYLLTTNNLNSNNTQ